jgi:hypothetical protein
LSFVPTKLWQTLPVAKKNELLDMQYHFDITHDALKFLGVKDSTAKIAERPDAWSNNQSPPRVSITEWMKTQKTSDRQPLFTKVLPSNTGDIDLWYKEKFHDEARMWLSMALLTIARCSGINPYTEYHKLGAIFTEPDRIVKLLEDEYNPLIVQQRQEFMLLELPPPPSADEISRGSSRRHYKTGRTKITKLQLTFDLDDADSVLSTDQSQSAATSSRRSRNSRSRRSTTRSEPRDNAVEAPLTPNASNSSTDRNAQRQHFSHDPNSETYASWADAASSVDSPRADRPTGSGSLDLSNTTTTTRSEVPTLSSRSWTEVVTNRTNILGRRRSGNLLGGVLNRGIGSSVATQSVLSANSVNSDVSTTTAATVLQLQTQIRDLKKSQEEKIQSLQVKHDTELSDIKAGHMSEIEKLHEAIGMIKQQIQELVLASSERARLASLQSNRESPDAIVNSVSESVESSVVSGTAFNGAALTLPASPIQNRSRRTLNGPKRARVSSSPQMNRFEILSPSSMDEEEDDLEVPTEDQEMTQDELQMDQDAEVEQTVQQVQQLQIQQQHEPNSGSNGEGSEPC